MHRQGTGGRQRAGAGRPALVGEPAGVTGDTLTAVFVGGGPRTVSILQRIVANAGPAGEPVTLHLIDPYSVGGGHIWRRSQSPCFG